MPPPPLRSPQRRTPRSLPAAGRLRRADRLRLAAEILATYVPMARAVRTNDLEAMVARARAAPPGQAGRSTAADHVLAQRLGRIVVQVLRPLPTDTRCLVRSLVLVRLLARRAVHADLVIGVRDDAGFEAHAWVEHDARAVLPAGAFDRLVEL